MVLVLLEKQRLKQQRQSTINQLKKNSTACLSYTAWLKLTYVVQRNQLLNQLLNLLSAPREVFCIQPIASDTVYITKC